MTDATPPKGMAMAMVSRAVDSWHTVEAVIQHVQAILYQPLREISGYIEQYYLTQLLDDHYTVDLAAESELDFAQTPEQKQIITWFHAPNVIMARESSAVSTFALDDVDSLIRASTSERVWEELHQLAGKLYRQAAAKITDKQHQSLVLSPLAGSLYLSDDRVNLHARFYMYTGIRQLPITPPA
jgi:hypothetical protein